MEGALKEQQHHRYRNAQIPELDRRPCGKLERRILLGRGDVVRAPQWSPPTIKRQRRALLPQEGNIVPDNKRQHHPGRQHRVKCKVPPVPPSPATMPSRQCRSASTAALLPCHWADVAPPKTPPHAHRRHRSPFPSPMVLQHCCP